jgi:hypothetical protein
MYCIHMACIYDMIKDVVDTMKKPYFQTTLNGRPLVFIFNCTSPAAIKKLRAFANIELLKAIKLDTNTSYYILSSQTEKDTDKCF